MPRGTRRLAGWVGALGGLLLALALAVVNAAPLQAQDASLSQMRLDLQNLRYQFDLETRQLRGQVERLQNRLQALESGRPLPLPDPGTTYGGGSEEVVARRFVVEDEQGRIRAVLGMSDRYGPMLALLTEEGDLGSLTSLGQDSER